MPKAVSASAFRFLELLSQNNGALDTAVLAKQMDMTNLQIAGIGRVTVKKGWVFFWRSSYNLTAAGRELLASNPEIYKPLETIS